MDNAGREGREGRERREGREGREGGGLSGDMVSGKAGSARACWHGDVSTAQGLAVLPSACAGGLYCDRRLAASGAVWADRPSEKGGPFGRGQHCGGFRQARTSRVPAVP